MILLSCDRLDWFSLEPDAEGIMRLQLFPSLWLATSQLLSEKRIYS
jgi:hypothetical protein